MVLASAVIWLVVPISAMFVAFQTPIHNISSDGTVSESLVTTPSQLVWAITGILTGLGLGWALISSWRRRLRRASWMPVVCLLMLVVMVTLVAEGFQPPVG